jgi:phage-related baseplate assembly protein
VRDAIQYAAQQNLLAFASFPMLDYLGQLLSVTRLASQPALTTLQFTLVNALTVPFTIAADTLVGTNDGQFVFATSAGIVIAAGATTASVAATATAPGAAANGYLAGQVSVQLNPNALIASVTNTSTTTGGSAPETDDHLRTRIQAAPNQFSVAGPIGAYRFFAIGADPSIIDAQVVSPAPGSVNVYLLTGPIVSQPAPAPNSVGVANSALLAKVAAVLSADTVRPLTDTVSVLAVTEVDFQVTATITLYSDADPTATVTAATAAVQELALELAAKIQRDIVPSQIIAALSVAGVYGVALTSPTLTPLTSGQWANCTMISLTTAFSAEHS